MIRSAALAAATLVALWPSSAGAQDVERARAAYAEGEAKSRGGDHATAARLFAEADAIAPNDTALEAAVESALLADDAALGMTLVERAQRSATSSAINAVGRARAAFERRTGRLVIPCLGEPAPCTATVDGGGVTAARSWVLVGTRRVSLRLGDRVANQSAVVEPGATVEVALPEPAEAPTPTSAVVPPVMTEPESAGLSPAFFFVGAGVTAVLGGLAIGHALAAQSNFDEFEDERLNGDADPRVLTPLRESGESLELRTNLFFAATGVAALGTAALGLFAVEWSDDEATQASFSPTSGGIAFRASGRF